MKTAWILMLALSASCVETTERGAPDLGDNKSDNGDPMPSSNKELVSTFFTDLNAFLAERDKELAAPLTRAFEVVADDVAWWVPDDTKPAASRLPFAGTKTKAQYRDQVVGQIVLGFNAPTAADRLRFTVKSLMADGDRVAAEVESDGFHVSGKRYQNRYHFLFTFEDGRITAVKEYMDTLHLQWLITR